MSVIKINIFFRRPLIFSLTNKEKFSPRFIPLKVVHCGINCNLQSMNINCGTTNFNSPKVSGTRMNYTP
jgi:hypothetical protein